MKLSVIICCYNSAKTIETALKALSDQERIKGDWEIILVDNNSTDNTGDLAKLFWKNQHTQIPLKIVLQKTPGLSHARHKGIQESKGEFILFCDDDNYLSKEYVNNAILIMENDQKIGALCGFNEPLYEAPPPLLIKKNLTAYACGHYGMESQYLNGKTVPWGAGLVVRAKVLKKLQSIGFQSMLSDRKGKELSSGGDTEFCYIIYLLGYKWKYDTRLFLKHFIPANRMNKQYLSDIYFGFGKANAVIEWYYGNGDMNRIKNKVSWWKVYSKQVLFYKQNKSKLDFAEEYTEGYLEQLYNDRKSFLKKRKYVYNTLLKLGVN